MYNYDPTGIIASTVNGEVTKYVKDPHGNVVVTSRNGSIVGEYDYSAFGEQLTATDTTNPFRYCGEYYDNENGLTYLRNRYYDSDTGRFLSEDPIKDGMNWYSYCGGDPVNAWDPMGLEEVLLKYIAEANQGNVSWDSISKTATVSFPGYKAISVPKDKSYIVNGRTVVDSDWLRENFNLSEYEATHHEGGWFDSADDAALAFALKYYDKSVSEQQEYGAAINVKYLRSGDKFWFTNVVSSAQTAKKQLSTLTDEERRQVIIQRDENSFADIHTHWRENGNYNFSDTDSGVSFYYSQIKQIYLVNRAREVKKLYRSEYENHGYIHGETIFCF